MITSSYYAEAPQIVKLGTVHSFPDFVESVLRHMYVYHADPNNRLSSQGIICLTGKLPVRSQPQHILRRGR